MKYNGYNDEGGEDQRIEETTDDERQTMNDASGERVNCFH